MQRVKECTRVKILFNHAGLSKYLGLMRYYILDRNNAFGLASDSCADPESFFRGDPSLTTFFFS